MKTASGVAAATPLSLLEVLLEVILHRKFHISVAHRVERIAGCIDVLIGKRQAAARSFEGQAVVRVRAVGVKLRVRMIDEVKRIEAELNTLPLRDMECLINRYVCVEKRRAFNIRPDDVAKRSLRRRSEATWVEVLAGF